MDLKARKKILISTRKAMEDRLPFQLGVNKTLQVERLIYELASVRELSPERVLKEIDLEEIVKSGKGGFFSRLKNALLKQRYPSLQGGERLRLMPVKISPEDRADEQWKGSLDIERIFVEKSARRFPLTERFTARAADAEVVFVDDLTDAARRLKRKGQLDKYRKRARNVFITKQRSSFIKICPCSLGCVRCGYWILNLGFGCPLDCAYCYLQTYSDLPALLIPANFEDAFKPLMELDSSPGPALRIGTGEFADSLALESYTGCAESLKEFFSGTKRLVLELKTKTTDISALLEPPGDERTVLSWSLNTPDAAGRYEKGAPPVDKRIEAASEAARRGFSVGFHFDPIIRYDGWRREYQEVVDQIFSFDALREKVVWISLGTLRYTAGLKQIAERRLDHMRAFYEGEFFEGEDGKMRYPLAVRVEMYNELYARIRKYSSRVWVYLCMETPRAWESSSLKDQARDYGQWHGRCR